MNKGVAKLFKLAPSDLHKLVSHQEKMVTVIKKKVPKVGTSKGASAAAGSAKGSASKSKVTVMKTAITPHLVLLEFFKETPALGMRSACKKKKEEQEPQGE